MFQSIRYLPFVLMLIACGSDESSSSEPATFDCTGTTAPAAACCDVSQAIIDACVRCGVGSESQCIGAVEDSVETQSLGRGCEGADSIRDEASFYNECLPALETIDCSALSNGDTPPSCMDQIQYNL